MQQSEKLELFAIVELFGHQRIAGKVTEQSIGAATFIRVDVPDTERQPSFTRLLNPSAIYAINPVTEAVANEMAVKIQSMPIQSWDVQEMYKRIMLLKTKNGASANEDDLDVGEKMADAIANATEPMFERG